MNTKFAVILPFLGQIKDRFATYGESTSFEKRFEIASQVKGLRGVELVYPYDFRDIQSTKRLLSQYHLDCSAVNLNVKADPMYHRGSFTSIHSQVRAQALDDLKKSIEIASDLGCNLVTICPLADGHDYPFEVDYLLAWERLREGIREAAESGPNVRIGLEYKRNEARTHLILSSAGITMHLCDQIGLPNVGVTLDIGHALYQGETPGQVINQLSEAGRLFYVHVNDNYRDSDWDLIPGTVNFWDWLESLFYLEKIGYDGWFTSDVFPARLDPCRVAESTYSSIDMGLALLEMLGKEELWKLVQSDDTVATIRYIQEKLLS